MPQPIRVALVEDLNVTREGRSLLIGGSPGFSIYGQYGSMEQALEQILDNPPGVLLADIGLPGMSGIEGVRRIHELIPALPIPMLTVHEDSYSVFRAVCAGVCGYLLKETPPVKLLESIRELYEGGAPMSPGIARKVVLTFQKATPLKEEMQLSADATFTLCGDNCTLDAGSSDYDYAQWTAVERNLPVPSSVQAITFSYGGGINGRGRAIGEGGFEPYLSLFDASGNFMASTLFGITCPPGANTNSASGLCYDVLLDAGVLAAGTYAIVISAFENMSFAENSGAVAWRADLPASATCLLARICTTPLT